MPFDPEHAVLRPSVMLSSYSRESFGRHLAFQPTPSSAAWTSANRMIYVPFWLRRNVTVYKFWWLNGGTVGTDNLRVAVYSAGAAGPVTRLILGNSVLSASANVCQYDDITDTGLSPGRYFMCLWCGGTTATVFGQTNTMMGVYYEGNAGGPQATATPVAPGSNGPTIPVFGLQLRSSP